jgi:hypothetical protein
MMASNLRLLGNNIKCMADKNKLDAEELAGVCGLTLSDIHRVFEGRLVLTPIQISNIASTLGCTINQLLDRPEGFVSYGECMGEFKNPDNEDKILNIIDDYIDLKESVQ